jgi:hypothetical protein
VQQSLTASEPAKSTVEDRLVPGKDCGYENPILKAITGFPMAMEGKTSAQ